MIEYEFYGTSHGSGYKGIIKGLPTGYPIDINAINRMLDLRKKGYGRSNRQNTEIDSVVINGLQDGLTTDCIEFFVANRQHSHKENFTALRSGHVDLVGSVKYQTTDIRKLNEIASGRNSLCYVVLGTICRQILAHYGIQTYSYTEQIGNVQSNVKYSKELASQPEFTQLRCCDSKATEQMKQLIDKARLDGDTLGGVAVAVASGVPVGVGDISPYYKRLDGIIAGTMMSIPTVKAVEIGLGKDYAIPSGRQTVDTLGVDNNDIVYTSNHCGGIVSGISNGQDIVVKLTVKPVPTIMGIDSIDLITKQPTVAHTERGDTTVVPTVGIVADCMLAYVLCDTMLNEGKIKNL